MSETMKMSIYNFYLYDHEKNLIIYNFLTGLKSLTKVRQENVAAFEQLFLNDRIIDITDCEQYNDVINSLKKTGILVASNINESVLFEAEHYNKIFDNKLTLTILPTGNCNFRCPYCFESPQSFPRTTMTIEAQKAIIRFVQKNIHNHQSLHISWFGGEPLLVPEIINYLSDSFIKICNARHIPYSADMTTNGFLLNNQTFNMLCKLKTYDYMITIDGLKEQHDKRRFNHNGKGSYDQIIENLLNIKRQKQHKFVNIIIRINMSMGFIEDIDKFLQFLAETFSDDTRFQFMFVPVVKFAGSKFPDDEIYANHNELFYQLSKNEFYTKNLCSEGQKFSAIIPPQKCPSALKNSFVITPDLKVYKCNAHYDFDKNNLGYITEKGDLKIDNHLHEQWFLTSKFLNKQLCNVTDCCYAPCCPNIDGGCPVSYLKPTPEEFVCPMKNGNSKKNIEQSILYMASNHTCEDLVL